MNAHYYLDVGATRIQTWLARTTTLKLRRGASILLDEASDPQKLLNALGTGPEVRVNEKAPSVSGVLHLLVDPPGNVEADAYLAVIADELLRHLRQVTPALEWQAAWARARTYDNARRQIDRVRSRGLALTALPVLAEFPLVRLCSSCELAPAVDSGKGTSMCADCRARLDAAGHATSSRRRPRVEDRLLEEVRRAKAEEPPVPDTFEELARAGDDTQIALVFADGNRIGALFEQLSDHRATSRRLDEATWTSLVRAVAPSGNRAVPMIPHLVGGDDLLVSVPAAAVWPFVRTFLTAFSAALHDLTHHGTTPTVSAGVVVSHRNHPFIQQVREAERLLKAAKERTQGQAASVAFLDVTWSVRPEGGLALSLSDINRAAPALDELVCLPRHARSSWETATDRREQARRAGALDLYDALEGSIGLDRALLLSRWWPRPSKRAS